jgi:RNA 2',3'-cyclic 3'-phosphodiesterase
VRLFFALLPDLGTRECLSGAVAELKLSGRARPVAPENLHITLAFVGEVPGRDVRLYREAGESLGLRRCAIELDAWEYWPNSAAVVLAGRENPPDLAAQTDSLRAAVAVHAGAKREESRWRAHATLARKVTQAPVLPAMSPIIWVSDSFSLMRSDTGGSESVYTVVDSWPLLDKT